MKYDDFDQYMQQGEPGKREKARAWKTAIGLQDVDGLTTSDYLLTAAKRHIDGDISIDEVRILLDSYYASKTVRTDCEYKKTEEADKVSANIAKLLNEQTFSFSPSGLASIHGRVFDGVFKFAGTFRDCNISKREWVLRGESVLYVSFTEIVPALKHDFNNEKDFSYKNLPPDDMIRHFAKFVSGIWQIHPFREGNTRTTAVFTIKYLRAMGFAVGNDLFAEHSWYFRNALVRANYRNYALNVEPEFEPLEKFFRNLLLGEHNELKNRSLVISPPEGLTRRSPAQTPRRPTGQADRTSTGQAPDKFSTDDPRVRQLINALGNNELTVKEMLALVGLKHRETFLGNYLNPAIRSGFVRLLYPDSPRHPRQKYLLTVKGLSAYQTIRHSSTKHSI